MRPHLACLTATAARAAQNANTERNDVSNGGQDNSLDEICAGKCLNVATNANFTSTAISNIRSDFFRSQFSRLLSSNHELLRTMHEAHRFHRSRNQ
jgi:hypothetical protein